MKNYNLLADLIDQNKLLPVGEPSQSFLRRFSATGNCGEPTQSTEVKIFALAKTNRNFIYLNGDPDFIPGDSIRYRLVPNTVWSSEILLSKIIKLTLPFGNSTIEIQKRDRVTNNWPVLFRTINVNVSVDNVVPGKVHDVIRMYNENLCIGRRYDKLIPFGPNLATWAVLDGNLFYVNKMTSADLFIDLDKYTLVDNFSVDIASFDKDVWKTVTT